MEKPRGVRPIDLDTDAVQTLFELDHDGNSGTEGVRIALMVRQVQRTSNRSILSSFAVMKKDEPIGQITGFLKRSEEGDTLEFRALRADNYDRANHPRIIGKTISELVAGGHIGRWYSGSVLTKGGLKLYGKYLSADSRLVVTSQCTDASYRYLVTIKTPFPR